MTAAVIVLLGQEGKLKIDDPFSKYVADVPNDRSCSFCLAVAAAINLLSWEA